MVSLREEKGQGGPGVRYPARLTQARARATQTSAAFAPDQSPPACPLNAPGAGGRAGGDPSGGGLEVTAASVLLLASASGAKVAARAAVAQGGAQAPPRPASASSAAAASRPLPPPPPEPQRNVHRPATAPPMAGRCAMPCTTDAASSAVIARTLAYPSAQPLPASSCSSLPASSPPLPAPPRSHALQPAGASPPTGSPGRCAGPWGAWPEATATQTPPRPLAGASRRPTATVESLAGAENSSLQRELQGDTELNASLLRIRQLLSQAGAGVDLPPNLFAGLEAAAAAASPHQHHALLRPFGQASVEVKAE